MSTIKDWSTPENIEGVECLSEELIDFYYQAVRSKKTLETLLSVTDDFIYIKDINHKFLYTSDAFARLTQHSSGRELVGKDDFDIFPTEHAEVYFEYEKPVLQEGKTLTKHEEPYYGEDGELRWVASTKNPVKDDAGNVIGLVGISKDITNLKKQQEKINYLATHDELTGLFNRRACFDLGEILVKQAVREEEYASLLYLDLDKFKQINDSYGHQAGDSVLIAFAELLKKCTRESDMAARIGGDEFIILMNSKNLDRQKNTALAERIINESKQCTELLGCTCSIGIVSVKHKAELLDLLNRADQAMYQAKKIDGHAFCLA